MGKRLPPLMREAVAEFSSTFILLVSIVLSFRTFDISPSFIPINFNPASLKVAIGQKSEMRNSTVSCRHVMSDIKSIIAKDNMSKFVNIIFF